MDLHAEKGVLGLQIVGVIFPVMIMALVPFRQYLMPYMFSRHVLHQLDAAEYEEVPPTNARAAPSEAADNAEVVWHPAFRNHWQNTSMMTYVHQPAWLEL